MASAPLCPFGDAQDERAPAIAWLRLWAYGDDGDRKYFYGDTVARRLQRAPREG